MSSGQGGAAGASGPTSPAAQQAALAKMGPPYPPQTQSLGTPPTPIPDTPVTSIFLVLFLVAGMLHMKLFQDNRKHEHKFPFSVAMFMFCMIRVISTVLRLAWIYHQRNIRLAIAAQIFVAAGTVILFVINLFFTQRLMRARHPHIGWHKPFKIFIPPVTVALTITGIIMVIVVVVQSFYTLNPHTLQIDRDVQWGVLSYFTFVAFLPIPVVSVMLVLPRRTHTDTFGSGKFRTKIGILLTSSALLTLGAGFRCGTAFLSPTPTRAPAPWYYSKAAFYCFDFLIEFIVVTLYLVVRVDRRFYIPDHAHGEGEYSGEMIPQRPTSEDKDVFTLSPDGRTLSLVDGRKFSTADKRTFSATELNGAQVQEPPTAHTRDNSFDDTASVQSHSYLSINRKSGKYEMRNGSESSFTPGLPDQGTYSA